MDMPSVKPGDLIAFSGTGPVSHIINLATFGIPYISASHIGIVADTNHGLLLFESTTAFADTPCLIQNKPVSGVQAHPIPEVGNRPGRVYHYPLAYKLYDDESRRLTRYLYAHIGTDYDMRGAVRSGGFVFRTLNHYLRGESLDTMFCSELVAEALSQISVLPTQNSSRYNPNSLIRRTRVYGITKKPERIK